MKRESAKQIAEERQRRATTRITIFLVAKGWIPMRTMLVLVAAPVVPNGRSSVPFRRCTIDNRREHQIAENWLARMPRLMVSCHLR